MIPETTKSMKSAIARRVNEASGSPVSDAARLLSGAWNTFCFLFMMAISIKAYYKKKQPACQGKKENSRINSCIAAF